MKKKTAVSLFSAAVFSLSAVSFMACAQGTDDVGTPEAVQVYMPDGAPALALAKLMNEGGTDAEYHVVDSSTIQVYVTGDSPAADVCVLPVNLASKLLGTGEEYQMLGTVTHGNLYMLSADAQAQYTTETLSALVGKTVGVVQLANVPGLTFKVILNANEIAWQELTNDSSPAADKVNLRAITPDQASPAGGMDCYVVPEPAASVKADKTSLEFVGDLQALYGGEAGYPQAVIVAKNTLIESDGEWLSGFLAELPAAAEWLTETEPATIVNAVSAHLTPGMTPSLSVENLSLTAIQHSGVRFESAASCKAEVNAFLEKLIAVNASAASAVSDAFYYQP